MKICLEGVELFMWTDGKTEKCDEANRCFSRFYERA